ncbi:uncharacterized protein LOC110432202 [Sorghum bicolor]|uniref:uncharacterized protein LOC110432202 n=1 Tax=Sorghum bicolor TaxID=4558 RepID=UPI00081AC0A2|nr:uncharacterized protein LOC110432202 [Sorghum bicolor]|eukprot:XP_021307849.1 uncharacterized protein LOC110432202 [Sorghum bicolor]
MLARAWQLLKSLVYYFVCGPSADHQHEPDARLMYPYDGYDVEAAHHIIQNQAVPPAAELRRRNLNPFSVSSVVVQTDQEKQRRQAVNDWMKQVGDALAVPQSLTRLAYFAEITLWTTLLLHRPLCPTSLAPTRELVAKVIEMILGFLAVSYTHCCIVSHHSVTTTALHISKRSERAMANMFAIMTCGWMICYTFNISASLYHNWIWAITVPFVLTNINNTRIYGYKGVMTEARILHI